MLVEENPTNSCIEVTSAISAEVPLPPNSMPTPTAPRIEIESDGKANQNDAEESRCTSTFSSSNDSSRLSSEFDCVSLNDAEIRSSRLSSYQSLQNMNPDEVLTSPICSGVKWTVLELVNTEDSYLAKLHLFISGTSAMLRGDWDFEINEALKLIPLDQLKQIKSFHAEFLYPQIQNCLANWEDHPSLSAVILKAIPFFKVYTPLIANQQKVHEELTELTRQNPKCQVVINKFLRRLAESCALSRGLCTLNDLLAAPFARLFQYKNIFERYAKELGKLNDASFDQEIAEARKAVQEMDKVLSQIECRMHESEKEAQLQAISAKLTNGKVFFKGKSLKLVRAGTVMKRSRKLDQPRYLILFDTHLIIAKPASADTYSINHAYEINSLSASIDDHDNQSFQLSVPFPYSSCTFRTSSAIECETWVREINESKNGEGPMLIAGYVQQSICLPPWKPDHMFTCCTLCTKRFTRLFRKHHCRLCGLVYCQVCSERRCSINGRSFRVCTICYSIAKLNNDPKKTFPASVTAKLGSRENWRKLSHWQKWLVMKDDFFREGKSNKKSVPYLREIIAASTTCSKSGYLYIWDSDNRTFIKRWVVLEQGCVVIFEASQNTVALQRQFLSGFEMGGPWPVTGEVGNDSRTEPVKFILKCFYKSFNDHASLSTSIGLPVSRSMTMPSRNNPIAAFRSIHGQSAATLNKPFMVFGAEDRKSADEWMLELQRFTLNPVIDDRYSA